MKKSVLFCGLVCFLCSCGDFWSLREKEVWDFPDTKIKGKTEFKMPNGFADCFIQTSYINEYGLLGVIDYNDDLRPDLFGLQIKVGVEAFGNIAPREDIIVFVNYDAYYTIREGNVYFAYVSIFEPVGSVLFKSYTTEKSCDNAGGFLSVVNFLW